jgi:hypothetical protein
MKSVSASEKKEESEKFEKRKNSNFIVYRLCVTVIK